MVAPNQLVTRKYVLLVLRTDGCVCVCHTTIPQVSPVTSLYNIVSEAYTLNMLNIC